MIYSAYRLAASLAILLLPVSPAAAQSDDFVDAISREISVSSEPMLHMVVMDAISREISVSNVLTVPTISGDAISREISVSNDPSGAYDAADAISREISLLNDPNPTPPAAIITDPPADGHTACSGTITIVFTGQHSWATPDMLQYSWRLDGGVWSQFSVGTSVALPGLSDGLHVFELVARLEEGPPSQTPARRTFYVDTTPPMMTNVEGVPLSGTQAAITWNTDEPATSCVDYGLTTDYGATQCGNPSVYVSGHSITLSGLEPNQTYHFRVRSSDDCGHERISEDHTFVTTTDITRPDTSITCGPTNLGVICVDTKEICWTGTDDFTPTDQLVYSHKLDGAEWSAPAADTSHAFAGLSEGDHTLWVRAIDLAGNEDSTPATLSFRVDLSPPVISNVNAWATADQATAVWLTDEGATSQVEYGVDTTYGTLTTLDPATVTSHRVVISGLQPGTTYHYRVISKDTCEREVKSDDKAFTTASDLVPPDTRIISGPSEGATICKDSDFIRWSGTDNVTPVDQLIYSWRLDTGSWSEYAPETGRDFTTLSEGSHTVGVKSKDAAGNEDGTPAYLHFRVDKSAPVITSITPSPSASQAVISWTTDDPSSSYVDYGTTIAYGSTAGNDVRTTQHSVTVTGLQPQTAYHFRVRSTNSCTLSSSSEDGSFTTTGDVSPPDGRFTSGPSENGTVCSPTVDVCWLGSDDVSVPAQITYSWKLDTGAWSPYSLETCRQFTGLVEGNHTLALSAKDAAGNIDASPAYRHFRVDLSAPVISNVTKAPGASQAKISWSVDDQCTSRVEYGLTESYGSTSSAVTVNTVTIQDLQPETTYHYRVKSTNTCGQETTSDDDTFTTVSDTSAPNTSLTNGPAEQGKACATSVQFCWTGTDDTCPSDQLEFSYKMDEAVWSSWSMETCHDFTDLSEGTHSLWVKARDINGNEDASPVVRYFFVDLTPPTISSVTSTPRDYSASITWNTNEPATSQVEYGLTTGYGSVTAVDQTKSGAHTVALRGLVPETTYHYRVKSNDGCRETISDDLMFTTTAVQPPNLRVTEIQMVGTCRSLERVSAAWKVRNDGPGSAGGPWVDRVYLSTDETLDSGDIVIGSFDSTGALDWASERWQTAKLDMPAAAPGTYYLIVKTDAASWVSETNESDNTLTRQIDYLMVKQLTSAPDRIRISMNPGETKTGEIEIVNLGDAPLTDLTASVEDCPANLTVRASAPPSIDGYSVQKVAYAVTAADESVHQSSPVIRFTTTEGAESTVTFEVIVNPMLANLVTNPGYLERSMLRGQQTLLEFEVTNTGAADARDVRVLLPAADWLTLVTPESIGTLPQGAKVKIGLALKPAADLPLGPYTGSIGISAANAGATIGFRFTAVSDQTGGIRITAEDEFTYFAENKPPVADATVRITAVDDGRLIAQGRTDASGQWSKTGLMEGYHNIEVTADKHGTFKGTVQIAAGETVDVRAFLPRQLVTYSWKVEPVQTEDRYIVTLETTFETHVPAPVVTVEPALIDLGKLQYDADGRATVDYVISNHGLIAANGVTLSPDMHPEYRMTPVTKDVGQIPAMSSVTVPVLVEKMAAAQETSGLHNRLAGSSSGNCTIGIPVDWYWVCGSDSQWHKVYVYASVGCSGVSLVASAISSSSGGVGGVGGGSSGGGGYAIPVSNGTWSVSTPPANPVQQEPCCDIPFTFSDCTRRHRRPGWDENTKYDGCGGTWYQRAGLQGLPFTWLFQPACNGHDIHYATCGFPKEEADSIFRSDMKSACDRQYPGSDPVSVNLCVACRAQAELFYQAVSQYGRSFYEDTQREACCCDDRAK